MGTLVLRCLKETTLIDALFQIRHCCCVSVSLLFWGCCFQVFNVPVFWPILLLYFIALFFLTMKRQVRLLLLLALHVIKSTRQAPMHLSAF